MEVWEPDKKNGKLMVVTDLPSEADSMSGMNGVYNEETKIKTHFKEVIRLFFTSSGLSLVHCSEIERGSSSRSTLKRRRPPSFEC